MLVDIEKFNDGDYMIFFTSGKSECFFVVQKYQDTLEEVVHDKTHRSS